MFSTNKANKESRHSDCNEKSIKAFLGAGSEFEGRMAFTESMRIDGKFSGEINSEDLLVVGETAELKAEVKVDSIIISGSFEGDVIAATKVELRSPAKVKGRIVSPRISIDEGVMFDGTIQMSSLSQGVTEQKA